MPSNFTENYNLNQWERTDRVLMEDFNADNAKLDAALSQKADQSALDALAQTVTGHTAALSKKGNVRVEFYTYTGTGTYSGPNSCRIPFTKGEPLLILVQGGGRRNLLLYRGSGESYVYSSIVYTNWDASGVSWYTVNSSEDQLNTRDRIYTALMFYKLD